MVEGYNKKSVKLILNYIINKVVFVITYVYVITN